MKKTTLQKALEVFKGTIVLGAIIVLIYNLIYSPVKDHNNVVDLISLNNTKSDTIRDDKKQLHAQKEIVYVPTWSMAEALYKSQIDSLREELKLSEKDRISSMATITTKTETNFKPNVIRDTTDELVLVYKNKWVDLKLTTDTSKLSSLHYRDSLTFATVKKSYGFLKLKEKAFVDVKSANPDVKHIGVNYFEVDQVKNNRSKWGVGFGIGPGLIVAKNQSNTSITPSWLTVNAGIQYRF